MFGLEGGCHCGNIHVDLQLAQAPETYRPRACDCDFCVKHGAAYISDPLGTLRIEIKDSKNLGRYQQGSGTAECLLCTNCGVLIGAAYHGKEGTFATINSRVVEGTTFGTAVTISPKELGVTEKVARWRDLWFPQVKVVMAQSPNG
jgi:hypothetical protein